MITVFKTVAYGLKEYQLLATLFILHNTITKQVT